MSKRTESIVFQLAKTQKLVREGKRNEVQVRNLERALTFFAEHRLASVIARGSATTRNLQEILSQSIGETLPTRAASYIRDCGVEYFGEMFLLPEEIWRRGRTKTAKVCREIIGELGVDFNLKLDAVKWIPPYANHEHVLLAWARRFHELGPIRSEATSHVCHSRLEGGCVTLGEFIRTEGPYTSRRPYRWHDRLRVLHSFGLRAVMHVPATWQAPPLDPAGCKIYGYVEWRDVHVSERTLAWINTLGPNELVELSKMTLRQVVGQVGKGEAGSIAKVLLREGLEFREDPTVDWYPHFSFRTAKTLEVCDITTMEALLSQSENELLRLPNFGRRSLNEVKEWLAAQGKHLRIETH
jgi:hypothetical protein